MNELKRMNNEYEKLKNNINNLENRVNRDLGDMKEDYKKLVRKNFKMRNKDNLMNRIIILKKEFKY